MQDQIKYYINKQVPFLFIIDFEQNKPVIIPLHTAHKADIYFDINGKTNLPVPAFHNQQSIHEASVFLKKLPVSFSDYQNGFEIVQKHLLAGNSYLVNLTYPTKINLNISLWELFQKARAKYKLWYQNKFLLFSPESFIQIHNQKIYSFPMKGTIDANLPNAKKCLLKDKKEKAEHYTIVDLIRNDLNTIAERIQVTDFRYIDRINTLGKDLLQVSSKIEGWLPNDYPKQLAGILERILPAGSISGAPKKKTLEIIKEAEGQERGYYTGVFGYYDNGVLDSGVMIRFIERKDNQLLFRSGGGITVMSNVQKEYQELIDKVYVPVVRNHQNQSGKSPKYSMAPTTI